MTSPAEITVRPATDADRPAVLELLADSLGWAATTGAADAPVRNPDERFADFFDWKHAQNPFGASPAWVAVENETIVGFRTFLRWQFEHPDGRLRRAVRAVDTATSPSHQGRGIFRRLTLTAVEALAAEGVDFVFNTPNAQSRPGYLRMGWSTVGRLPIVARVRGVPSALRMRASRVPAERWPVVTAAGAPAGLLLADARVGELLGAVGPADGLRTARTPAYLRWRYGLVALGYRAIAIDDDPAAGLAVFRVRRRGDATEAGVSDLLVPHGAPDRARRLLQMIGRQTGADYTIRVGRPMLRAGYLPLPRQGPILTWRPLADPAPVPDLRDLDLSLGDVELL
jgi:GNAT superfamily N-acetyltransferase